MRRKRHEPIPLEALDNRLAHRRRSISIAARSAVKRCRSIKRSWMWSSAQLNSAGNIYAGVSRMQRRDHGVRRSRAIVGLDHGAGHPGNVLARESAPSI